MSNFNLFPLALLLLAQTVVPATAADAPRERVSLDAGWRFCKGDSPDAGTNLGYAALRPWLLPTGNAFSTNAPAIRPDGEPAGAISYAQPDFNDSQWRLLNLPHDWGIEGPFKQEYPGETGKLPWWGVAWYRQHLTIPAADAGKEIYLDVDGAMSYATVWLNGKFVGGWPYGYSSWRVDLTPYLKFGGENIVAIRLDNPPDSSRWYPGGGIYRNVWLVKTAPVCVAKWGTHVTTSEVNEKSAKVKIKVAVDNSSSADAAVTVRSEIFELKPNESRGRSVATFAGADLNIPAKKSVASESQADVPRPKLWSVEKPQRYVVVTTVEQSGGVVDLYETPFGIRTTEFTVDKGFFLNGRHVILNGVCNHSDLGALGTVVNVRGLERQLEIMREMGVNAIRTSHNPPAPELLDLCDRMGFVVMDEAFDCWLHGKNTNDYHVLYPDWHEQDLRALVRRDRNHPCVILWSSGNEVPDQSKPDGPALAEEHRAIIRSEDGTRPVTTAVNAYPAGFSGFQNHFDVFGWNYKPKNYGEFRATNADIPIYGSETASALSSRGEYFFPLGTSLPDKYAPDALGNYQVSSYDLIGINQPDADFIAEEKYPFVAGQFVWTGFDYLGEPTPYRPRDYSRGKTPYHADWTNSLTHAASADRKKELAGIVSAKVPSRSSYFGIVDLAGFKKDRFYLYQSYWRPDFPMAHILPHWNWPERVGQVTPVYVYTSGDAAELFLNGKSLGMKKKDPFEYRLRWDDVVYQPGELKVVAYKDGKNWATDTVKTTGTATKLALAADRKQVKADGKDLAFITVTVADQDGLQVPCSKNHIKFEVEGPGEIVATDNGDATSFESFQAPEHNAYNGLALVIVRAQAGHTGNIVLQATSPDLKPAVLKIKTQ